MYGVGCILQTASTGLGLLVAGRLIAGFGVGFVSAIIILYMSEIAPKGVRGAIVSGKFLVQLITSLPNKRQATNLPSRSVSSWHPASITPQRTEWTQDPTVSLWLFSSCGH